MVRALVRQYGDRYVDALNLCAEDTAGHFDGPLSGAALLARAEALTES